MLPKNLPQDDPTVVLEQVQGTKIDDLGDGYKKKPLFAEWNKINYNYYYNILYKLLFPSFIVPMANYFKLHSTLRVMELLGAYSWLAINKFVSLV